jgi:hypothetical protein
MTTYLRDYGPLELQHAVDKKTQTRHNNKFVWRMYIYKFYQTDRQGATHEKLCIYILILFIIFSIMFKPI